MTGEPLAIPSRSSLEEIRESSLRYQERICALLEAPFRTDDLYLTYLMEIYAVAGNLNFVIDEYMYGIEPGDEVYLTKEDLNPITSFTRAMASGVRLLRRDYNVSLIEQ